MTPITIQEPFMNSFFVLFAELLISVIVSLMALRALSGPLINVLCRICPDEQAATFWVSYTKIMLMLAPLLLVLLADMLTNFSDPISSLRLALIAALAGLLMGLYSVGKRLGQFVTVPKQPGSTS
jgi:hypothetical protein